MLNAPLSQRACHRLPAAIALALLLSFGPTAHSQQLQLLVPAYFYPVGSALADWDTLATTAKTTPVSVIFNPNSGPGTFTDSNYVAVIQKFKNAGGTIYAYVYTSYGARSYDDMARDIDSYYTLYPGLIQGFFLDEVAGSATPAQVALYHLVQQHIAHRDIAARIIGNPGAGTPSDYLQNGVFNTEVTFEHYAANYAAFVPDAWAMGFSRSHFAHILHSEPQTSAMLHDLQTAQQRNAGFVYVTDSAYSATHPNPYDRLPTYWNAEAQAVNAANATGAVSGRIALEGVSDLSKSSSAALLGTFHIAFRTPGATTETASNDVSLTTTTGSNFGAYAAPGVPLGTYDITIKGSKSLRVFLPNVTVTTATVLPDVTLPAGDANNDNSVDSTDFGILIGSFNTSASVPGNGYDATADFNFDGFVDSADFGLLIGNFNTIGAP